VKALLHITFFIWATTLGRILIANNFRRRRFELINQCFLCKKDEETINHLLLHCEFTVDIWHLVLNSFGVSWVTSGNVLQLFHCWKFLGIGHPSYKLFGKLFPPS
jgi:hypothetical protein